MGISGWLKAQSSVVGTDLGVCFRRLEIDRLLRRDSGVEGLPLERVDRVDLSSASSEGTDSEEGESS